MRALPRKRAFARAVRSAHALLDEHDEGEPMSGKAQDSRAACEEAVELYRSIAADYFSALEATGVAFAPADEVRQTARDLIERIVELGGRVRNGGASVVAGAVSEACVACTGSCISRTLSITNDCHRDCYFCFNPNQINFAYYCEHDFPWREELSALYDEALREGRLQDVRCLALSGGEPMLRSEEVYAFFERARELFSPVHTRIYTSGDLLDDDALAHLSECGVDEIRFSVKLDDPPAVIDRNIERMARAKGYVGTVMVEMPVIPGTDDEMRSLLRRFDDAGVDAINLLEFTYPMWNWEAFASRGFTLKNPPFPVAYDYTYAGSLAVEGSEEACLGLMVWAMEEGLSLGLHYCSLENKHRAQIRNENEPYAIISPCYALDYADYFLKTALVFGRDCDVVEARLRTLGVRDFLRDPDSDSLSFNPKWIKAAASVRHSSGDPVHVCISSNVAVPDEGSARLRELKIEFADTARMPMLSDETADLDDSWPRCPR